MVVDLLSNNRRCLLALGVSLLASTSYASQFLAIRQGSTLGNASFSIVDTITDETIQTSDLSFPYQYPHIEATANSNDNLYYVVSYPLDDPNGSAHLYELDSDLNLNKEWIQPAGGLMFFDLQYSTLQNQLYGIAVNGKLSIYIHFNMF